MNHMHKHPVPLLGFAAYSGTGKTTLLCRLIPLLRQQGLNIGVVKHAHHDFEIDDPEKDSCKLRESGAQKIVVAARDRTAIIIESPENTAEPTLEDALKNIHTKGLDLILVEGFKRAKISKIELHRKALNRPFMYPHDPHIIALALDHELEDKQHAPRLLDLNKTSEIAAFINQQLSHLTHYPE